MMMIVVVVIMVVTMPMTDDGIYLTIHVRMSPQYHQRTIHQQQNQLEYEHHRLKRDEIGLVLEVEVFSLHLQSFQNSYSSWNYQNLLMEMVILNENFESKIVFLQAFDWSILPDEYQHCLEQMIQMILHLEFLEFLVCHLSKNFELTIVLMMFRCHAAAVG